MTARRPRALDRLEDWDVPYEFLRHRPAGTAQEAARETGTPAEAFAKAVVLRVDDARFAMVVVPAGHELEMETTRQMLGAGSLRPATGPELDQLFPDCETGAQPPLGNLYGVPVHVCESLCEQGHLTFRAGSREVAVRMLTDDFLAIVRPATLPTWALAGD